MMKVARVLKEFAATSGLTANLQKSNVYMGGFSVQQKHQLLQITREAFSNAVFRLPDLSSKLVQARLHHVGVKGG